jgi:hypothetical protein
MRKNLSITKLFLFLLLLSACESSQKNSAAEVEAPEATVNVPAFNASNAYVYIEQQVAFGARIPNTEPHQLTKAYLMEELEKAGAKVVTQEFTANTYDKEQWRLTNIIGSILPEKKKRILLAAHWDSRKMADKDSERKNEPIDGANDGASGVGVIIEILNAINTSTFKPEVGVDVIFFDGEDNGEPEGEASVPTTTTDGSWWCLGSQHWSKNKHEANYSAYYGILFDMVGAANATFYIEGFSNQYAPSIVSKVWSTSEEIGFGNYFVSEEVPPITDDHYYVNKYAKIPMIDIIPHDPLSGQFFPDYHHTHQDNMDIISQETLKAVGQTVLRVIYKEKP